MYRSLMLGRTPSVLPYALRLQTRAFALSAPQRSNEDRANGKGIDDTHSVNKVKSGNEHGQHEQSVKRGQEANQEGGGDNATARRDAAGGKDQAKKEFPEAPDPGLGMQDERGGKGV